ncbi:effector-associated constant component EACC1 [Streptomyces sp. NPDC004596]
MPLPDPAAPLIAEFDGPFDELASLYSWLRQEEELRGRLTLDPGVAEPGSMGGGTTSLVVALVTSGAAPALARTVRHWLSTRTADVKMSISQNRDGTTKVILEGKRIEHGSIAGLVDQAIQGTFPHRTDADDERQ